MDNAYDLPRSESFSCFCLGCNISFPVAISKTTYSDTYTTQSLQSCRNFDIFLPELLRRTRFEGVGGREELRRAYCKPIGCARPVWKWILRGYLIAPGNCLPFVWCHPRRQFPITLVHLEAYVGMPRLLTLSWQNLTVDARRKTHLTV